MANAIVSNSSLTPTDVVAIIIRKRLFIFVCVVVSAVLASVVASLIPLRFKSTATLAVENQKIPENYVKDVLTGNVQDRLGTIQQMLLSRSLLTDVIKKHELYQERVGEGGMESVISRMRKSISISPVKDHVFSIAFIYHDAFVAQQVTATLAELFMQENNKIREQMVEGANEFLSGELDKARVELERKEKIIGEFKQVNMGELPQQLEANLRSLDRLQLQAVSLNETLDNRLARLAQLEKVIQDHEAGNSSSIESVATVEPVNEMVASFPKKQLTNTDPRSRIKELRQNLARLQAVYKDSYPDVVVLKDEIRRLEDQLSGGNEEFFQGEEFPKAIERGAKQPEKKAKVDIYLKELLRQKGEIKIEVENLRERIAKIARQIKEYERRVEQVPQLEQQLQGLTRDYENMQRNYQSLLDKRLNAKISENLEHHQKGEHFRVIDKASYPLSPEPPSPLQIILLGILGGVGVGVGGALVAEQYSGVFRKPEHAEGALGISILATIPNINLAYVANKEPLLLERGAGSSRGNGGNLGALAITGEAVPEQSHRRSWHMGREKAPADSGIAGSRMISKGVGEELNLVAKWRPHSVVAEQFRVAATRLVLSANPKCTVVVVTSAVNGEGKTTTSSNLAYVLAHDLGKKTALIDCDFKRPMVHRHMGIPSSPGLMEAIYGDCPIEACIHSRGSSTGGNSLSIVPCGRRDRQALDLTNIPKIRAFVDSLRDGFDFIIIDAPPILPLADMNLLGELADRMVLVLRLGQTSQSVAQAAIRTLRPVEWAGLILTGAEIRASPYFSHMYSYTATQESYSK